MKRMIAVVCAGVFFGTCAVVQRVSAALTIAADGKSDYSIIVPQTAPDSVNAAAAELQRDIELAAGVKLAIVKDNGQTGGKFISLGSTKQARDAGVGIEGVADSGFRMVTQGDDLYILGLDTAAKVKLSRKGYGEMTPQPQIPGPQYTKDGGFSNGTANGVYTFLEDYLNVSWLMPGDLGRDVPTQRTIKIDDLNRTEAPLFIYRVMSPLEMYTQALPAVAQWQDRQKLGFSFRINHNHSWMKTVSPEVFKEHPDWFALIDGKRMLYKTGQGYRYKLETTNPELVKYFAEQAIAALKADPHMNTYSLSPSDSRGWSESTESRALYDPAPQGSTNPSMTPLILKFYRDVSQIVEKEYPQGKLAGYLYQDYIYPPTKGGMTLPENFIPFIAPSFDYGYRLYRPDVRAKFESVMSGWAKVAPSIWFYYDLPNQILSRYANGIVTPPATGILNFIFPRLLKDHIKGSYFYGNASWSQAAVTNYIVAKLLWNPKLDANKLQRQWLDRAYGPAAGALMESFYQKLDGWFETYYQKHERASHNLYEGHFKEIYGPNYAELESLFLKAKGLATTDAQRQRLQLIGDNMIVLRWRLHNAGYLPKEAGDSPLKRSDEEVAKLLFTPTGDFSLFPVLWYDNQPSRKVVKVRMGELPAGKEAAKSVPNGGYVLLYPTRDSEVRITPGDVHAGSAFLAYRVYEQTGVKFREHQEGLVYANGTIKFPVKAKTPYYLRVTPQGIVPQTKAEGDARYTLTIAGAATAKGQFADGTLYLEGAASDLYVFVPSQLPLSCRDGEGAVTLEAKGSAQAARAALMKRFPDARVVRNLDEEWRFEPDPKNTGLSSGVTKGDFKDAQWKTIDATDWWQNQGFEDYHGAAWYRKTFAAPKLKTGEKLLVLFGAVDGDAVVYLNGKKVGEHRLGRDGAGWDEPFDFDVTSAVVSGENTLAVQVTKETHMSGIYKGVSLLAGGK